MRLDFNNYHTNYYKALLCFLSSLIITTKIITGSNKNRRFLLVWITNEGVKKVLLIYVLLHCSTFLLNSLTSESIFVRSVVKCSRWIVNVAVNTLRKPSHVRNDNVIYSSQGILFKVIVQRISIQLVIFLRKSHLTIPISSSRSTHMMISYLKRILILIEIMCMRKYVLVLIWEWSV